MAEHEERGDQPRQRKTLPLNTTSAAVLEQSRGQESEQSVAGAVTRGFAGGFLGSAQNIPTGRGTRQGAANPSWQKNNREVVALNTKVIAASARTVGLLDHDIAALAGPSDSPRLSQLLAARTKAMEDLKALQESAAHDEVNVDVQAGAHTEADVMVLRQDLHQRHEGNTKRQATQQHRGGLGTGGATSARSSPVRNAAGQTLADLTEAAPGEDQLPGMSQPLVLDVLDAVQGLPPRRGVESVAKGVTRGVVMNPQHVAGLKALEDGPDDGMGSEGSRYGR